MSDLVDTTEMYLRTILDLEETGVPPLRARIAEYLGHSGPTVSQTIARMQRDGLVVVSVDRNLVLTVEGRQVAISVLRKHRLAELMLQRIVGMEWKTIHDEACRLEHVMSDQLAERLWILLEEAEETPYGTPIPGPEDAGFRLEANFKAGLVSLLEYLEVQEKRGPGRPRSKASSPTRSKDKRWAPLRLRRIGEIGQTSEVLSAFDQAGIRPGDIGHFKLQGQKIAVSDSDPAVSEDGEGSGNIALLPTVAAEYIFVERV